MTAAAVVWMNARRVSMRGLYAEQAWRPLELRQIVRRPVFGASLRYIRRKIPTRIITARRIDLGAGSLQIRGQ
jgi:hypothetical protein